MCLCTFCFCLCMKATVNGPLKKSFLIVFYHWYFQKHTMTPKHTGQQHHTGKRHQLCCQWQGGCQSGNAVTFLFFSSSPPHPASVPGGSGTVTSPLLCYWTYWSKFHKCYVVLVRENQPHLPRGHKTRSYANPACYNFLCKQHDEHVVLWQSEGGSRPRYNTAKLAFFKAVTSRHC